MKYFIALLLIPYSVLADTIPNFECWDIRGQSHISTASSFFATRHYNSTHKNYIFISAPDMDQYLEYNISSEPDKGFYYGSMYTDKEGTSASDIKCKKI